MMGLRVWDEVVSASPMVKHSSGVLPKIIKNSG